MGLALFQQLGALGVAPGIQGAGEAIPGLGDLALVSLEIEGPLLAQDADPGLGQEQVALGRDFLRRDAVAHGLGPDLAAALLQVDVAFQLEELAVAVVAQVIGLDGDGFLVPRRRGQGGGPESRGAQPAIVPVESRLQGISVLGQYRHRRQQQAAERGKTKAGQGLGRGVRCHWPVAAGIREDEMSGLILTASSPGREFLFGRGGGLAAK